ncbi:MAG: glutathione S-transferase family protein [Ramlibacter sp.]|nr:glutathione S-transferase family protein [Ramlibacter sp.]
MNETYTLYGSRGSGSAAVEVALEACGLAYRMVRAATWEPDSALEELRRVNPMQQIPTLVLPDGGVMTESAAILLHLGFDVPAGRRLLPEDSGARAQAIRGLVFIAANCYSAISIADYPERWTLSTDDKGREDLRQGTRKQLHRHWEVFADTFTGTPFLSGAQPGALDFLAAVVSKWAGTRAHLRENRPKFLGTLESIEAHDIVAPVFARHWDA